MKKKNTGLFLFRYMRNNPVLIKHAEYILIVPSSYKITQEEKNDDLTCATIIYKNRHNYLGRLLTFLNCLLLKVTRDFEFTFCTYYFFQSL